jgi:hypothetical protein
MQAVDVEPSGQTRTSEVVMHRCVSLTACVVFVVVALRAQSDGSARYEVVSIKKRWFLCS